MTLRRGPTPGAGGRAVKEPLSLKGRALALLAQREQSEFELRRKLTQHALKLARSAGADEQRSAREQVQPQVDGTIEWLKTHRYLDERRFVESRLAARAPRYGNQRIRAELAQHGLGLSGDEASELKHSEFERAKQVWQRKFGVPAADAAGRARQARFLTARGFTSEVVRRIVLRPAGATRSGDEDT